MNDKAAEQCGTNEIEPKLESLPPRILDLEEQKHALPSITTRLESKVTSQTLQRFLNPKGIVGL